MSALGMIALAGAANSLQAQTVPNAERPVNPGMQVGPVAFTPAVRLSEFGHDSNVYNRDDDHNPVGDFISTLSPSVDAWFRFGRLRASGHSQADLYYYRSLPELRAADTDNVAEVDLVVNRVRLFVVGSHENTQRRQNLEVDAIARRKTNEASLGAEVRLSGKTSLVGSVQHASLEYAQNSFYLGTDLAAAFNYTTTGERIGVRYAATRLTTLVVDVTRDRAKFDTSTIRNSDEVRIVPAVEFSPFALVTGHAAIAIFKRSFTNGTEPAVGTAALVDLSYVLLGRTRFNFGVNRRLEYSYLPGMQDYILEGETLSVTQRLGESWDVGGVLGTSRISYRELTLANGALSPPIPDETVLSYEIDLGYKVGRARVGFYFEHRQRTSDLAAPNRGYERVRTGSTVTYAF